MVPLLVACIMYAHARKSVRCASIRDSVSVFQKQPGSILSINRVREMMRKTSMLQREQRIVALETFNIDYSKTEFYMSIVLSFEKRM